jgi:hypothetical protein
VLITLAVFAGPCQLPAAEVSIPGCPGVSVDITNRSFVDGDRASCQASAEINLGPDVLVDAGARLTLSAPRMVLTGPLSIDRSVC